MKIIHKHTEHTTNSTVGNIFLFPFPGGTVSLEMEFLLLSCVNSKHHYIFYSSLFEAIEADLYKIIYCPMN